MTVAVVTGANRGIGKAVTLELLRGGHDVWAGTRDLHRAQSLRDDAVGLDGHLRLVELDVSCDDSVERAFSEIEAASAIDILINNAAVPSPPGVIESQSLDDFRVVMETNFYGPLRTMKAVVGGMRQRRAGTIINISSIGTIMGAGTIAPYVAAKSALEGLTLSVASQLSAYGVTVTLLLPGFVRTEILDASPKGRLPSDDEPYGRLFRRSIHMFAINTAYAADPKKVADAVIDIIAGRGRLRNPAGDEMERIFQRLGVADWTAPVEISFIADDREWAATISDLYGRPIPPPEVS